MISSNSLLQIGLKVNSLLVLNAQIIKEKAIDRFIQLSNDDRRKMGLAGRQKVEKEFDRQIVVQKYMDEVEKA